MKPQTDVRLKQEVFTRKQLRTYCLYAFDDSFDLGLSGVERDQSDRLLQYFAHAVENAEKSTVTKLKKGFKTAKQTLKRPFFLIGFWSQTKRKGLPKEQLYQFPEAIAKSFLPSSISPGWSTLLQHESWQLTCQLLDAESLLDNESPDGILSLLEQIDRFQELATSIETAIDAIQAPIVEELNQLLDFLAGKMHSVEEVPQLIARLRFLVAKAGCELTYHGEAVSVSFDTTRRKLAAIKLVSLGDKPSKWIYNRREFPELLAAPVTHH